MEVKVYPNPTQQSFRLHFPPELRLTELELLDLSGRQLRSFGINQEEWEIKELSPGHYLLKGVTSQGIFYKTLQVKPGNP